jgi:hypothetical protein
MTKTLKLSSEELNRLTQFEASIAHWSNEYTVLTLKSKKMLEGVDNLYVSRQKLLDDFIKSNDIKASDIESLNVSPNGDVVIELKSDSSAST